jgi:hypothetical protein
MPLKSSVGQTLASWGARLYGTDLEEEFVRAARIRLALLASRRLGKRTYLREERLAELLPKLRVADGRASRIPSRALVVLNPPYGSISQPGDLDWATGRVNQAAVFAAAILENAPQGTAIAAILPDVLRSGTNYMKWREHIGKRLQIGAVEHIGLFDNWADVDVFVVRGEIVKASRNAADVWGPTSGHSTVGSRFEVNVGAVVPHRDPKRGPAVRYLTVHDLPLGGSVSASALPLRRFTGRVFAPPFVAIRRTSRPDQLFSRAMGTVVRGKGLVAVENHVLVCTPANGTIAECEQLQNVLHSHASDAWLDERIRCRHLTVLALRDIPWRGRR